MTMQIRPYHAHSAHFVTITDGPKESTILAKEGESIADTLRRYMADERHTMRAVAARLSFYEQALTLTEARA